MAQANAELRRLVAQRGFGAFCKPRDLGYWRSCFGVRAKFFDVCLRILATNSSLEFLSQTTLLTEGLLARTVRLATDPWYCRHPRLHEARHSKIRWPFSSTTNTRFDRQNSPAFLNSAARNLACYIASSGVERLFPTSSGKTFGPSKI